MTFQHQCQRQVEMYISFYLFYDWFPFEVSMYIQYSFDVMRNKLQTINIY